jgi:hypothetical protein
MVNFIYAICLFMYAFLTHLARTSKCTYKPLQFSQVRTEEGLKTLHALSAFSPSPLTKESNFERLVSNGLHIIYILEPILSNCNI